MRIIILICLSCFTQTVFAQSTDADSRFGLAVVLGLNASQLDGDDLRGYDKLGLRAGLQSTYLLNEKSSLGLELLFSQKGSSAELQLGVPTEDLFKIHLNYVEVPIYYNFREWQIDFHAGLSYGRLISAKTDEVITGYAESDFRKDDFNVLLGATYSFNELWGLGLRYTRSLVNLFDNPNKNRNGLGGYLFSLQLNYHF